MTGFLVEFCLTAHKAWTIGFNAARIALAAMGLLSPWLAVPFHHISSVLVVLNSARISRGWKGACNVQ